jgi:hypothetical protein
VVLAAIEVNVKLVIVTGFRKVMLRFGIPSAQGISSPALTHQNPVPKLTPPGPIPFSGPSASEENVTMVLVEAGIDSEEMAC